MTHGLVWKVSLSSPTDKVPLLGTAVNCLGLDESLQYLDCEFLRAEGRKAYIRTVGLRQAADSHGGSELGGHSAGGAIVLASTRPFIWAASLLGRPLPDRVTGLDLLLALCDLAQRKGYSCYFLGEKWYVVEPSVAVLTRLFPGMRLAGFSYLDENPRDVVALINDAHPGTVFISSEHRKQEAWASAHLEGLSCSILAAVGDAFDVLAARNLGVSGWQTWTMSAVDCLWCLLSEPRRLLMGPLTASQRLLVLLFREFWSLRRRPHLS